LGPALRNQNAPKTFSLKRAQCDGRAQIYARRDIVRTSKFAFLLPLMMLSVGAAGCSVQSGQESTGEYVDSAAVSTQVKTKLATDGSAALANQVKVETLKDVVQLSGFVPSDADRTKAEQIAWSVDGVRGVENDIIVQP
jgi:hyperosmotically inducible periplasmic protein